MRSHAKAPSAGSISTGSLALAGALLATFLFSLAFAGQASAAKVRLFKEALGGGSAPTFTKPLSVAVDQSNGDVLVLDGGANEVQTLKIAAAAGQFRLTYAGRTTTATATGDTSTVTTPKVIKNLSSVVGTFTRGEAISGTGIPAGATISKIISATEIEISANATATNAGVSLTADGLPFSITAANLKLALEDLLAPSFTTPIAVSGGPGSAAGGTYTITFNSRDANELVVSDGTTPLSGGTPTTEKVVTTTTPGVNAAIKRYKPDGSADNFSGLGTNVIDGQRGPGGKTKAECESAPEPASCDETPVNGLRIPISAFTVQVAVDNSGTATNGNIYLTQRESKAIYAFSSAGKYLGQITAAGATPFAGEPSGVAVAPNGHIYVGQSGAAANKVLFEFAPSAATPANADFVRSLLLANVGIPANVAAGAAGTLGAVFVAKTATNPIVKVNSGFVEAPAPATSFGSGSLVAVNPTTAAVFVSGANNVATEYDASSELSAATQESTLTVPAGSTIQGLAVRGATDRVYLSRTATSTIDIYGPVVSTPTPLAFSATEVSTTKATLNGSVNAEGDAVSVCKFEYLSQAAYQANGNSFSGANVPQAKSCAESIPVDAASHPASAAISGLQANTTYRYRLFAENGAGSTISSEKTLTTSPPVITGDATGVGDIGATLYGTVNPVGTAFSACKFEYLTAEEYAENGDSYSGLNTPASKNCTPSAGSIEADFQAHAVSAALTGLAKNTTYHFRLSATNVSGTATGTDRAFTTLGPPQIVNQWAFAEQTSATLSARIDPSGFATTYHFEWGTDDSYGKRIPADVNLFLGSGTEPIEVSAEITGLTEATAYHFRLVASNESGASAGEDRRFDTLSASGLPDNRGAELVSPADKGPVGVVGNIALIIDRGELLARASEDGNSVIYPFLNGNADSTAGGLLRELASRGATGWRSTQLSSPSLIDPPELDGIGAVVPSFINYSSPDLSCGVMQTYNPLTADTPQVDIEEGVHNLYRWDEDGSYELISNLVPLNPHPAPSIPYTHVGASPDCRQVYFRSGYKFFSGASGLYEWDGETLRDAGELPDGTPGSGAVVGGETVEGFTSRWNSVSSDGSRFFFSAISDEGKDSGKRAVFMRDNGDVVDVSQSQTAVGPNGALYETASPDGSHVFFRANYGIAATSSAGPTSGSCAQVNTLQVGTAYTIEKVPCDLYDYDVETGELTDLSADLNPTDPIGAAVQGVVAVSDDGSRVYFAALGQLVPGKGKTYAQNVSGLGSANIYLAHDGQLTYVTTLAQRGEEGPGGKQAGELFGYESSGAALMRLTQYWVADTTPDGRKLLFVSSGSHTGYESGGVQEAYLYSADTEEIACVSCRPDGQPSVYTPGESGRFDAFGDLASPLKPSLGAHQMGGYFHPRALSDGGSRVFFTSRDVLASGGVAKKENVYEWENGQVYFLAIARGSGGSGLGSFLDSSASGDDVFIATSERLAPQDTDLASDVYDLRVGGGFAPPPPPPPPCDPAGDECQGPPAPQPTPASPPSAGFSGPGNPPAPKAKGKAKKRPHKKQRKRNAKRRAGKSQTTKSNRGGAK